MKRKRFIDQPPMRGGRYQTHFLNSIVKDKLTTPLLQKKEEHTVNNLQKKN